MGDRITVYWDVDGNGWAWRYADRSGGVGGDLGRDPKAAISQLHTAARAAVYADRVLCLTMGQVAALRVELIASAARHLADVVDPRD